MKRPVVSVIIPCYGQAAYLAEAVASVFAQTYPEMEAVIVNDGSPDDTDAVARELVERYAKRRIVYVSQENAGLCAARNAGLAASSGQFISFLDADDTILPEKVERQLSFLEEHPEYDVAYCDVEYFGEELPGRRDEYGELPSGDILPDLVRRQNFIRVHTVLLPRRVYEKVGGFDRSLANHEDWDYWLRISGAGFTFGYISEKLARYRIHLASMSNDGSNMLQGKAQALRLLLRRGNLPADIGAAAREGLGATLLALSLAELRAGRSEAARRSAAEASTMRSGFKLAVYRLALAVAPGLLAACLRSR